MDDMTISTYAAIEAKWTLKVIEELISWVRTNQSRKVWWWRTKGWQTMTFELGQDIFPFVSEKPVKWLKKYFDNTPRDSRNTTNIVEHIVDEIDRQKWTARKKQCLIYQHRWCGFCKCTIYHCPGWKLLSASQQFHSALVAVDSTVQGLNGLNCNYCNRLPSKNTRSPKCDNI